ncbi:hypothetical protein WL35_07280 [Burkholderia ubonensis]|uniref:hypothetical protein n=1 Tax=Burkholderia ubonensis TaxID=101571 RepID=UPI0007538E94|nr:hypothetical protein [Burkholderia ubonensis]KWB49497.1 hypothetical protein WL35_07280 [Burkholderia ubonensis]
MFEFARFPNYQTMSDFVRTNASKLEFMSEYDWKASLDAACVAMLTNATFHWGGGVRFSEGFVVPAD